ncbi:arylsulfatase F [Artibeus jamaicensis]|uniref:arylsulfatase F n=1 Tax=Artibeus jamaicensis TaxID=9417 RepID=UPI00235B1E06|nr:arylsulfatase F [Artibeus jamaicensis]
MVHFQQSPCLSFRRPLVCLSWMWFLLNMAQSQRPEEDKPNILLIMADDLGIGDLGCYGNDTIRTPNIDRLATESVKLMQHIAASSVCTPSRSAFLTGRYSIRSGMASTDNLFVVRNLGASSGLPVNETTFASLVKEQGYSTAIIGKWHQGLNCQSRTDHCHHPHNYGFDYFYGMPFSMDLSCWPDPSRDVELALGSYLWFCVQLLTAGVVACTVGKLARLISVPWSLILFAGMFVYLLGYFWFQSLEARSALYRDCILMRQQMISEQPLKAQRAGTIMVDEAISFLERHRQQPFLLFFSFLHVHMPLPTTTDFLGTSRHGLYGDNVQEMDFFVGKLLAAIDDLGLRNRTVVYFASDHGGHLEARLGKMQLGGWNGIFKGGKCMGGWEGGIRVPGLFRWPGKLQAGKVIHEPTSLMDIFPTIAALTGGTVPQDRVIDGRNLMPLLRGEVVHSEHEFLFHYCDAYLHAVRWHPVDSEAVWKVHYVTPVFQPPGAQACYETYFCECVGKNVTYHDPPLLFDLSRDPSESTPLTNATEPLYDLVIATASEAVKEHRKTIIPVELQLNYERNHDHVWLRPCCGVFPFCLCDNEDTWSSKKQQVESRPSKDANTGTFE